MKIVIAGGGNMGRTYAHSFISNHTVPAANLFILERSGLRVQQLRKEGFVNVTDEPGAFLADASLLILAVKPQDAQELYPQLLPWLTPDHLILSIMAGVRMEAIARALPVTEKIIRAMPNLPAQIGMGMTGFTVAPAVSRAELITAQNLLNATGKSLYFEKEELLDAVTAVSGSGPAYVYFFMEAMIKTAVEMGFTETQAELLVEQTFMGAVHMLNLNSLSCREWINRVSSRGGTTEAAMQVFQETSVGPDIRSAMLAALQRSEELGR